MSKSLIKIIDYAVLPALLMVFGKIFGVFLVSQVLGIKISINEYADSFLSISPLVSENELMAITSYSDLIMYAFVAGIFSIVLIQAVFLHNTHTKPTLVVKLADANMLKLIQNSYDIYHSAFIHLLFLWIVTAVILVNGFLGKTYIWITLITMVASIIFTTILLQDIYKEIENIKSKPGSYNWK